MLPQPPQHAASTVDPPTFEVRVRRASMASTMKAAVNTRYGPPEVLEIREVPKPEPRAGEVLVKVYATTVSRTDCGMLRARPAFFRLFFFSGLFRPKRTILGMDFAGKIDTVGAGVGLFKPGERVFGLAPDGYGAHAEYLCIPETGAMAIMPATVGFDEVVVGEGALYANANLKALGLKSGQKILVYGASGAIGTAAVQLAKYYGAEVTAVVATRHLDLVKGLGADHVIDYTTRDFSRIGETFDCVLDAVGKTSFFHCRRLLKPDGVFATTDPLGYRRLNLLPLIWRLVTRRGRFLFPLPKDRISFVQFLGARMAGGEFHAVIDRKYPLQEIVEAYRYVETGQKTGIVVIDVASDE
jgi:NADPH:quinone reductase-like Zn-dependent oxidoreductase